MRAIPKLACVVFFWLCEGKIEAQGLWDGRQTNMFCLTANSIVTGSCAAIFSESVLA